MTLGPVTNVGHISQGFGTSPLSVEPSGYLETDAKGPKRYRKLKFDGGESRRHVHPALDVACPIGTPILAPERSKIVEAGTYTSTGEHYLMLQIRPGTIIFFTHLRHDSIRFPVGKWVTKGTIVARSGNSGMSTGPHLHWEVRRSFANNNPDPKYSASWFRYNPKRCQKNGDLGDAEWLQPI